jgi:hypothetical protein
MFLVGRVAVVIDKVLNPIKTGMIVEGLLCESYTC